MDHIIVERVRVDSGEEINTNNHPRDPDDLETASLDYFEEQRKTNLTRYAEIIGYPIAWTYQFTQEEVLTLIECSSKGMKIGRTLLFKEELEPITARLKSVWKEGMWFFRFDSCSPKDGNPKYPVYLPDQVIDMITTSKRAWQALNANENVLYFVQHDPNWDTKREFRVFVRKRRVTCISQYNSYTAGMLTGQSNIKAKETANRIVRYLEDEILPKVCPVIETDNVSVDVYVPEGNDVRIVEFNSFGYWQAAGSALFHWLRDKKKLYNEDGKVWLRFIK